MLKKRLGSEAIEINRPPLLKREGVQHYFKVPSILIIPEGCENIGDSAFYYCDVLKEVVIPESVVKIRSLAFWGCSSLKEVVIPRSVEYIGDYAFYGCTNATIILKKHKKDFKAIYSNSFADCKVVKKEIGN